MKNIKELVSEGQRIVEETTTRVEDIQKKIVATSYNLLKEVAPVGLVEKVHAADEAQFGGIYSAIRTTNQAAGELALSVADYLKPSSNAA